MVVTLALILLFILAPAGRARPADAFEASRLARAHQAAEDAAADLDRLASRLRGALDLGRRGTAAVVAGDADPAPDLRAAAEALVGTTGATLDATVSAATLQGILASVRPDDAPLPPAPAASELPGIASQLAAAAEASGAFVERRLAARATVERIGGALAALDREDPDEALGQLARARHSYRIVAAWEEPPTVLPVWLDTTAALIDALERLSRAVLAGDARDLQAARAEYRGAAADAHRADAALAISIAEAGSAVAGVPLRRMAQELGMVEALRERVASVMLETS